VLTNHVAREGSELPITVLTKYTLAHVYFARGKYKLAEPLFNDVVNSPTTIARPDGKELQGAALALASIYESQGKPDEAAKWRAERAKYPPPPAKKPAPPDAKP
jgi:TolA-binding protein